MATYSPGVGVRGIYRYGTLRAQHLGAGGGAARGGGARAGRDAALHAAVRRRRAACTPRDTLVTDALTLLLYDYLPICNTRKHRVYDISFLR